jgi:wyosine [tRNA(Phe)-imidazoG37] synthetase (radical SAM superfamily)
MKYIYGPIKSRRLGNSLGLTLTPHKTCTFDCVYCQLGRTTHKTLDSKGYVVIPELLAELKDWLLGNQQDASRLSYITLAGFGEPTLNSDLGQVIEKIKLITRIPIAVITNSSLLSNAAVRQALLSVDLVVPSLDAVNQEIFEKIDRPAAGISVKEIIEGMHSFKKEYKGKIWLEVMLIKGINDGVEHIRKLKEVIELIQPDKIQLNSPVRKPAEPDVLPVGADQLEIIKGILGGNIEII